MEVFGTKMILVPVRKSYQSPIETELLNVVVDIVNFESIDNKVLVVDLGSDSKFTDDNMYDFMQATLSPTVIYLKNLTLDDFDGNIEVKEG